MAAWIFILNRPSHHYLSLTSLASLSETNPLHSTEYSEALSRVLLVEGIKALATDVTQKNLKYEFKIFSGF